MAGASQQEADVPLLKTSNKKFSNKGDSILPNLSYLKDSHGMTQNKANSHTSSISPASSLSSLQDVNTMTEKIRELESEKLALMIDHNNLIKEFNKRMESHLDEIRSLKESNQMMEQESTELRDLCVFLDDDRQKCRKLAKEWQRFGRHTVTVMRNEVLSYQNKLQTLEKQQSELVKENGELRDLCVYLDNQRTEQNYSDNETALRYSLCKNCSALSNASSIGSQEINHPNAYAAEQIQRLQERVQQVEKEKDSMQKLLLLGGKLNREKKRVSFSVPDDDYDSSSTASEIDKLDYPPSFGSNENILKSCEPNVGILRNGNHSNLSLPLKGKYTDSSLKTSSRFEQLRDKFNKSNLGENEDVELALLRHINNAPMEKLRSGSNVSIASSQSIESNSPLSPPPSSISVPLCNGRTERVIVEAKTINQNVQSTSQNDRPYPPGYTETLHRQSSREDLINP